ncbi:MAG: 2OG-Fe(II) oxygenase [Alphaproteobacteria bacterium]|nr:2OG-Fe(II) oxygenase [Alphaproteobacteria bacterium]
MSSAVSQAVAAAQRGDTATAARLLEAAAASGDVEAAFELALWYLEGAPLRRDLAAAARWFGRAGELGRADAAAYHRAFLAHGAGGARDWRGALAALARARDPAAVRQRDVLAAMALTADGDPLAPATGTPVGGDLPITLFEGFLTADECAYLIGAAEPFFTASVVVDPRTGAHLPNPIRTSDTAFFPIVDENPAIHALNRRIAAASGTRPEQGEPLQVLRYAPGQEYRMHSDALPPGGGDRNQRILTFLVYLNDDYEGGATLFEATGLALRPRAGDAVLFHNTLDDGRPHPRMRHAGQPVTRGVKYLASRWIRARPVL